MERRDEIVGDLIAAAGGGVGTDPGEGKPETRPDARETEFDFLSLLDVPDFPERTEAAAVMVVTLPMLRW